MVCVEQRLRFVYTCLSCVLENNGRSDHTWPCVRYHRCQDLTASALRSRHHGQAHRYVSVAFNSQATYFPLFQIYMCRSCAQPRRFFTSVCVLAPVSAFAVLLRWGSSIAQGGVVQNAGMPWPTALQRILDAPLLNFGFSGMCRMQPEVVRTCTRLRPV